MIKKELELIINTGQAENALQGVDKSVNRIDKDLVKTEQEFGKINTDAKQLDTTLKKVPKSTKKIAGGFRMMGTALKAAGVGLILLAFATLKELFEQNQKVVDTFNIAFESLSLAFADFFKYISENVGAISGFFKKIFDDPLESVKRLGKAIFNHLIKRMIMLQEASGFLAEAFSHLFSGEFKKALNSVNNAAGKIIDSVTGVDDTTGKLAKTVKEGVTALTEYTTSTVKQATANVELKKTAELASVANQGLIEKFDLLAEKQRQIRDDERKSIEDRKKANDELGIILEKQQALMLSNAQIQLKAAKIDLKKDKDSVEFKKAVMEAENELAAVRAQIAGFRSEQQTNEAALEREAQELIKSRLESENNLSIERKRFLAEQIKDERERLLEQQRIDAEEEELGRTRLNNEIALYVEGTQAKVDAEIALAEFEEQIYQQKVNRAKELGAIKVTEEQKASDKAKDIARLEAEYKENIQAQTLSAISSLIQAFANSNEKNAERAFQLQKGLAIVETLINTSKAIMKVAAETIDVTPIQALRTANMIAMGVAGAAQVAAIATRKFNPSGASGGSVPTPSSGGAATSPSQAPSFNVVGQSGFNQVAGALGQQQPVQAFVVAGNVTTAQQLQNNTIQTATF